MRILALGIMGLLVCCASVSAQPGPIFGSSVNITNSTNSGNNSGNITNFGTETINGSGRIIEASLSASNFNRLDMAAIGNLRITRGTQEALRIKVDDNLLPYFATQVVDGVLRIYLTTSAALRPTQPPEFTLSVLALQEIRLSGAANIDAPQLEAEQFTVTLTGAGNVALAALSAQRLTVWLAGAGDVLLAGRVAEQDITLSGSGSYQAGTLTSTQAAIRLPGAGNAELQVSDVLQAEIQGAGTIRYRGHPHTVEQSVSGAGTIIAVE
jgi:Putative auto-transporter adhesin, head GIN domain